MKKIYKHNLTIDFKNSSDLENFHNCEWLVHNTYEKDSDNKELFEVYISNGNLTYQIIDIHPTVQLNPHITSFTMAGIASILLYTEKKNTNCKFTHNISFIKNGKVDLTNYQQEQESNTRKKFKSILTTLKTKTTFADFEKQHNLKP